MTQVSFNLITQCRLYHALINEIITFLKPIQSSLSIFIRYWCSQAPLQVIHMSADIEHVRDDKRRKDSSVGTGGRQGGSRPSKKWKKNSEGARMWTVTVGIDTRHKPPKPSIFLRHRKSKGCWQVSSSSVPWLRLPLMSHLGHKHVDTRIWKTFAHRCHVIIPLSLSFPRMTQGSGAISLWLRWGYLKKTLLILLCGMKNMQNIYGSLASSRAHSAPLP